MLFQYDSCPLYPTIDGCYSSEANNQLIYKETVSRVVEGSLAGINGTLFMYGQTGAGKTFTMMGDYSNEIAGTRSASTARGNRTPLRSHPSQSGARLEERARTPISKPQSTSASFIGRTSRSISTYSVTMNEGVLVLSLKDLFGRIEQEQNATKSFFVRCSYFEIYNDSIYDLLTTIERLTEPLNVSEDSNVTLAPCYPPR